MSAGDDVAARDGEAMGSRGQAAAFVPDGFAVPRELVRPEFRLEPLGPQHNEADHEAWTTL